MHRIHMFVCIQSENIISMNTITDNLISIFCKKNNLTKQCPYGQRSGSHKIPMTKKIALNNFDRHSKDNRKAPCGVRSL